jgi:nicotinate-nucleotide adenylyltransferase
VSTPNRGKLDWSQITAVLGGTFDPPHVGHLVAARGLLANPGVRQVLVLPSAAPPHKPAIATAPQRLDMAKLTFGAEFRIDPRELERASSGRPSYTYDTLRELNREIPPDRTAFVIGTDQLAGLPRWNRFPDVVGLCHWIVLKRQGAGGVREALAPLLASNLLRSLDEDRFQVVSGDRTLVIVPTSAPELSSTGIRQTIALEGRAPEAFVTPEVSAYLKLHRIYGTQGDS